MSIMHGITRTRYYVLGYTFRTMVSRTGDIVLQREEVQCRCGNGGPISMHVIHQGSVDGAGHVSGHWNLIQSWRPIPVPPGPEPDSEDDLENALAGGVRLPSSPDQSPDVLRARREVGMNGESGQKFQQAFDELEAEVAADAAQSPDTHRSTCSLVREAGRTEAWIAREMPTMDPRVRHLALIILHVYKLRLMSVWVREHVLLAHLILGRGEERLRAHERCTYVWDDEKDCWVIFEGMLPESTYTFVKLCLLQVEGLLRHLDKKVARNDQALLQARACCMC